jgi:hypothetical protein
VTDLGQATEVTGELFPLALLSPGHDGDPRVVLQRAGATLGAATSARLALVDAGFGVVEDRAPAGSASRTRILVADDSPAARTAGADAAAALGLPESVVEVDASGDAVVDVRVVLGADAVVARP